MLTFVGLLPQRPFPLEVERHFPGTCKRKFSFQTSLCVFTLRTGFNFPVFRLFSQVNTKEEGRGPTQRNHKTATGHQSPLDTMKWFKDYEVIERPKELRTNQLKVILIYRKIAGREGSSATRWEPREKSDLFRRRKRISQTECLKRDLDSTLNRINNGTVFVRSFRVLTFYGEPLLQGIEPRTITPRVTVLS